MLTLDPLSFQQLASPVNDTPISAALTSQLVEMAGQLDPLASLGLCMAPMATMPQLRQQRHMMNDKDNHNNTHHMNLPLLPYSSMVACTFVWTVYGILHDEHSVWMSNGVGLALASYYCWEYAKSADDHESSRIALHRNSVGVIVVLTTIMAMVATRTAGGIADDSAFHLNFSSLLGQQGDAAAAASSMIGLLADTLCVALFASPLAKMAHVVQTRSSTAIPWAQSVATTINCGLWSTVGLWGLHDMYIAVPNTIGLLLGVLQLSLKVAYSSDVDENDRDTRETTTAESPERRTIIQQPIRSRPQRRSTTTPPRPSGLLWD